MTFTAFGKIYSTEYFCNTKVAGFGEIFVQQKFYRIWYNKEEKRVLNALYALCMENHMCQEFTN